MKKEFFKRAPIGAMAGLVMCHLISLIISFCKNDGNYYPYATGLEKLCGNDVNAVAVQTVAVLIYGGIMAGISVIWDNEKWSLTRQTVTHLIFCSAATLPIAYFMHWIEQSLAGVLGYYAVFLLIYFIIWAVSYINIKRRLNKMNSRIDSLDSDQ